MTHFFDVSALGLVVRVTFDADADASFIQRASDAWSDAVVQSPSEHDVGVAVPLPGDEDAILERLVGEHDLTSKSVGDCRESTYGQLSAKPLHHRRYWVQGFVLYANPRAKVAGRDG